LLNRLGIIGSEIILFIIISVLILLLQNVIVGDLVSEGIDYLIYAFLKRTHGRVSELKGSIYGKSVNVDLFQFMKY